MYNGLLLSSSFIFDKIYRDFNFDFSLNYNDVLEWIGEGMRHLKTPSYYVDKVTDGNTDLLHQDYITITGGRGELPCDLYSITQTAAVYDATTLPTVRSYITSIAYCDYDTGETCSTGDGTELCCDLSCSEEDCNTCSTCNSTSCDCTDTKYYYYKPMRWNTNSFYKTYHGTNLDFYCKSDLTYTVNNNYIFTNFSSGKVVMAYKAVPTDLDGFPMIPDQQSVIDFLTWFVGNKIVFQMWINGKIADKVYDEVKGSMQLYYMKAKNEGKMPSSLDEWQSYANQRLRFFPDLMSHSKFFKHLQAPQEKWNHPRAISTIGNSFNFIP